MINKTEDYKVYNQEFTYEDGETWDFIGYDNEISFNQIVAQGINFNKVIIEQDDWLTHIEYSQVIKQDNNETIMHTRLLTNYYTDDINKFELDAEQYITIKHNKPLSEIKRDYAKEKNLFKSLKQILSHKGYIEVTEKCCHCDECYDCINRQKRKEQYQKFSMQREFTDEQTIGEVKNIFDSNYESIQELAKAFFNAETHYHLFFTEQGAIGEIEVKHYIK